MRKRLYLQIYVAFVVVALLCVLAAGLTARALHDFDKVPRPLAAAAELLAAELPPDRSPAELQAALEDWGARMHLHLGLWEADGHPIASTGHAMPGPEPGCDPVGWFSTRQGPGVRVGLADGRWLAAMHASPHLTAAARLERHLLILAVVAALIGLGCYPVARRITRRLEALQQGVDHWGDGHLSTRVEVDGRDEVARLAESFNGAADRVEALVEAQQRVLASASHELRSPLARLRMAIELMEGDEELSEGAARDIDELDALVGDILLSSRLGSGASARPTDPVDLAPLAEAEAIRVGARFEAAGEAVVAGDARVLRRLVRNLVDNARRHGDPDSVEVQLERLEVGDRVRLQVADRGPGVPEGLRERIFEPYYRPDGHAEGIDGGVGLGLALVREIAQHHGGEVRYRPRDGGGSRFEVDLPAFGA